MIVRYGPQEHWGLYGIAYDKIYDNYKELKKKIIEQCTPENVISAELKDKEKNYWLVHYRLESGLHVYGMVNNCIESGTNCFCDEYEVVCFSKEAEVTGSGPKHANSDLRIHDIYNSPIYLLFGKKHGGIGIGYCRDSREGGDPKCTTVSTTLQFGHSAIATQVKRVDINDKVITDTITGDIDNNAESIIDIFKERVLNDENINPDIKDEIMKQVDELQKILGLDRKNSGLQKIMEMIYSLGCSEEVLQKLTEERGNVSLNQERQTEDRS